MYKKITAVLLMTCSLVACTKNFEKINTNPNAPIDPEPQLLLRQVIYDFGENMSYEGFVAGNLLGQYFTMVDFNLFDRHNLNAPQFGGKPWNFIYTNLRDNETILQIARSKPVNAVYEGPALVLKSYMAAHLTDIYGNVPYYEALKGKEGNVTPAYSTQESIYTGEGGILDNLKKAVAIMEGYNGSTKLNGDILFNGDLKKWIRFANSLRIKYLVRISGKKNVSQELQQIYTEGNFIQANANNAKFDFTDGAPNNFRFATLRIGDFNLFIMSKTFEDILKTNQDPRIATFFRPTSKDPSKYAGLVNGPDASKTSITIADYSLAGTIFRENTGDLDANFMTAWETGFLLAEAAQKGLISADAKMLYDQAITASFEYWQTPMPQNYLTTAPVMYDNSLEQVITQKWIANMLNGFEGWIEWRRTGFPQLQPVQASLNGGAIPTRMPYPADEAALNTANYNNATATLQGNNVNAKTWWDD